MVLEIETLNDGTVYYEQITPLDGRDYKLIFSFNGYDDSWYLTIRTDQDERIEGCEGMRLVQGGWPLRKSASLLRPPGQLFVSGPDNSTPGLMDLGNNSVLTYITAEEMEQLT